MKSGVLVLNFGEPEHPVEEEVVPFLERIFYKNARLEHRPTEEERRARSRELALERAPGLMEEYRAIGGSPLNRQARDQATALESELAHRGHQVQVYSALQFTRPLIGEVVAAMRADGVERVIALPVYPLCGHSTTVAALDEVEREMNALGWNAELIPISGWHRHPLYGALRADGVRALAQAQGMDLNSGDDRLLFSAHGTPLKYLEEGSGYNDYVLDSCATVARLLEVEDYLLGYQNHGNRAIPWTQPDVEAVVTSIQARRVLVVPISFMHEQSETLAELDHELREKAEEVGLEFHRAPVPHDDPRFSRILGDLVEPFLDGDTAGDLEWGVCRCRPRGGTRCLNAPHRD
ncbi:MAG: ferrochelatase [Gemmatimonadota bacterium]